MRSDLYQIIALGARYWFALLGVLIVVRSFLWLHRDHREKHRRLRSLPDAGTVGELVVLAGSEDLSEGSVLPLPWEGTLGYVRGCDLVVPVPGVARTHLDLSFREGTGLVAVPRHRRPCLADGVKISSRREAEAHPLQHRSVLQVGEAVFRVRLFMGLDIEHPAVFADGDPDDYSQSQYLLDAPQGPADPGVRPEDTETGASAWPARQSSLPEYELTELIGPGPSGQPSDPINPINPNDPFDPSPRPAAPRRRRIRRRDGEDDA